MRLATKTATLLALAAGAHAALITVGGDSGWTPGASIANFSVNMGDTLLFNYGPFDDVWLIPDANATMSCDFSHALLLADRNASPLAFNATFPGTVGFASSAPGHCLEGQRVVITVRTTAPPQRCAAHFLAMDSC